MHFGMKMLEIPGPEGASQSKHPIIDVLRG